MQYIRGRQALDGLQVPIPHNPRNVAAQHLSLGKGGGNTGVTEHQGEKQSATNTPYWSVLTHNNKTAG
jgi:hypothetical protein